MMKRVLILVVMAGVMGTGSGLLAAEPAGELKTGKVGELVIEDDFGEGALGEKWAAVKGKWEIADGALVGAELAADEHAAVLNLQHPHRNGVVQFDFELDGAGFLSLSLNHAKGHLWRVTITESGLKLQKDKDKKDPASKTEIMGEVEVSIEKGKRYTLLTEISGPKIAVQLIGEGVSGSIAASHAAFDTDKPNIRFVTKGESVVIDNVKVWDLEG